VVGQIIVKFYDDKREHDGIDTPDADLTKHRTDLDALDAFEL